AASQDLISAWGPGASSNASTVEQLARASAVDVASKNEMLLRSSIYLDANRDVRLGFRSWNANSQAFDETWGVPPYNLVEVTVRRDVVNTGCGSPQGDAPLNLFFGPAIGNQTASLTATATTVLYPVVGFKIPDDSELTAHVLPIAFDETSWNDVLLGIGQDNFSYDPVTQEITGGSDGIIDFDIYPTNNSNLPSGNRGTVDLGSPNNSTSDLRRQIISGLDDNDLSYFGGTIRVHPDPLLVNGDPGISAGIKSALQSIVGHPRAVPVFRSLSGSGNNATYEIVKFVGVRVLAVKLTGGNKFVIVQSAPFNSVTAIHDKQKPVEVDSILGTSVLLR
ncbi:MAG: hypothetical protein ABGZ17_06225, partial [Planctomycetaceae bacterium]